MDKEGPSIKKTDVERLTLVTLVVYVKKGEVQDEMLMNEITQVSCKNKRIFNTFEEEEVKQKNISESFKNENEDLEFVGGLHAIMRVKVNKEVWNDTLKTTILQ